MQPTRDDVFIFCNSLSEARKIKRKNMFKKQNEFYIIRDEVFVLQAIKTIKLPLVQFANLINTDLIIAQIIITEQFDSIKKAELHLAKERERELVEVELEQLAEEVEEIDDSKIDASEEDTAEKDVTKKKTKTPLERLKALEKAFETILTLEHQIRELQSIVSEINEWRSSSENKEIEEDYNIESVEEDLGEE